MTVDITVRPVTDAEFPDWTEACSAGFTDPGGRANAEMLRPYVDLDRVLAGFVGDRVVSTLRSFPTRLTLPGGAEVSADAVTGVTVLGSHRRRGLATRMVEQDLRAAKERGEQAAVLIAAEWPIYGRFGFGPGTQAQKYTLDAVTGRVARPERGSVEYVDAERGLEIARDLHGRLRRRVPGEIEAADRIWDSVFGLRSLPSWGPPKPHFTVVARDEQGTPVGVARYRVEQDWPNGVPRGTAVVPTLMADGPVGLSLLVQLLLELDWVGSVSLERMPVDGQVEWLLNDPRLARVRDVGDFLWWRPLDLEAVLTARSYPFAGQTVLRVHDPLGLAGGTVELVGTPEGGHCTPTDREPDVTMELSTLSAVALGGHGLATLAGAGLVEARDSRALVRADDLFRCRRTPFSRFMF